MNEGLANATSLPEGFLVISGEVQPGDLDRIRLQWPQVGGSDEPRTLHVRPGLTVQYAPVHKNQAPGALIPEGILLIKGEPSLTDEQIAALRADWDRFALRPGLAEPIGPGLTAEFVPTPPKTVNAVLIALQGEIHANARAKGFAAPNGDLVPQGLALIHSEVSEAMEVYRRATTTETLMPDAFLEELADVVIRTLDMAHACSAKPGDFARILLAKVETNKARPPMHGGRRC